MKRILLLTSSALTMSIMAGSANAASIADLFFKPMAGQIVSTTTYDLNSLTDTSDVDTDGTVATETIDYGLSDKNTLSLTVSYGDTDDNSLSSTNDNKNGFYNPEIALSRRIAEGDVIVDLNASITPDVVDTDDSDNATDATEYSFGMAVSGTRGFAKYSLSADMIQVASGSGTSGAEAYSAAVFTMDNQFTFTDKVRLNPSISYTDADGTDTNYVTYGATLSYDITEELVVYAGVRNINYDITNKQTSTTTLSLKASF